MRYVLIALVLFLSHPVYAANRPATASDCTLLTTSYKVPCVVGVTPFDPDNPYFGDAAVAAKAFLKSLPKQWAGGSTYDCKTYEDKNIDKLNPQFAICMANWLREYTGIHGMQSVTITSAYRSYEEQKCVCVGEKGLCGQALHLDSTGRPIGGLGVGHQYGTAVDIHPKNKNYPGMWSIAEKHGVWFRLGWDDRPHVEPKTPECGLGMSVPPPGYAGPTTGAPTSPLTSLLRSVIGSPMSQPIRTAALAGPLPSTQSPLAGFQAPPPVSEQLINTNTNITTTLSTTTSIADILRELAFGKPATTTPIVVGSTSGTLVPQPRAATNSPQWSPFSIVQSTFVSQDLSWRPTQPQTPLQKTLEEFRRILLSILPYVQPFRPATPSGGSMNTN